MEAAKALSVNAPGMAEIDSLKALKTVVDAVAKGIADQEKKAALAEARTKVMTVLDRILAISHVDGPNFTALVFMVPLSFSIGALTRVGQSMGEGNPAKARFVAWTGTLMCIAFGALSALGIALFRWHIAAMYSSDAAVQATCASLLLLAAIFQLSDSTQVG